MNGAVFMICFLFHLRGLQETENSRPENFRSVCVSFPKLCMVLTDSFTFSQFFFVFSGTTAAVVFDSRLKGVDSPPRHPHVGESGVLVPYCIDVKDLLRVMVTSVSAVARSVFTKIGSGKECVFYYESASSPVCFRRLSILVWDNTPVHL